MARLAVLGALASLVLFTGCREVNPRVSVLWTDIPEVSVAVEAYNASQKDFQILLEVKDDPQAALSAGDAKPDLVIARGLTNRRVRTQFSPLNYLFQRALVTREQFYSEFLFQGMDGDKQLLIPVSFNIPVLIFKAQTAEAAFPIRWWTSPTSRRPAWR